MGEENPCYALQDAGATHPASLFRLATASAYRAVGGVIDSTMLETTPSEDPDMNVWVGTGNVWVPGTTSFPYQGPYYCVNDAPVELAIAAADEANPRIDLVVAAVIDAEYVGGATNEWALQVVTGTPAADPVAPDAPVSSLLLAQVTVPAGATSITTEDIADGRAFAHLIVPAPTALLCPPNALVGSFGYEPIYRLYGVIDGETDGDGLITADFPTAFANGVLDGRLIPFVDSGNYYDGGYNQGGLAVGSATFQIRQNGAAYTSSPIIIGYVIDGF